MNFPDITAQIVQALSFAPERGRIDSLFADMSPEVVEWSVNIDGDPRGRLRVAVWPTNVRHARDALIRLSHPFASSIYDEIEQGIHRAGVGVALSANDTTVRLWAAPRPSHHQALLEVALRAEP